MVQDPQTSNMDDFPLTNLMAFGGHNTCRQKANTASQGHYLNSLTIATVVDSHEEQKVNLSTVLMDGSYIRLTVIKAKETSCNCQVPLLCDLWQVSEILSFLILICKLKRLLFLPECC